jgi:hypothetical protein
MRVVGYPYLLLLNGGGSIAGDGTIAGNATEDTANANIEEVVPRADFDALMAQFKTLEAESGEYRSRVEETERAEKERDEARKASELAQESLKQAHLRMEVERQARKLNIVDEDAAFQLLDKAQIVFDNEGKPINVGRLLEDMARQRAWLVGADQKVSGGGTSNPARGGRGAALALEDVRKMTPEQINERWGEVRQVMKGSK